MKPIAVELKLNMRACCLILLCLAVAGWVAPVARADSREPSPVFQRPTASAVDRILVRKGERRLYLLSGDEVMRSYRVSLGLEPVGRKDRSGDFRTPEGVYRLGRRNRRSDYFLSIQITYPNRDDMLRARRNGWQPGGSIMIHGLPNEMHKEPEYYATQDWTNGCIALSNADMLEIWTLVSNNTPIEILP